MNAVRNFVHMIAHIPVENSVDNVPKSHKTVENPVDNVQNLRTALWKTGGNGVELLTEMHVKRGFLMWVISECANLFRKSLFQQPVENPVQKVQK